MDVTLQEIHDIAAEIEALAFQRNGPTGEDTWACYVAEEVGECIGVHNKIQRSELDAQDGLDMFATEWAQSMLNLMSLGRMYLTLPWMERALRQELASQRSRLQ